MRVREAVFVAIVSMMACSAARPASFDCAKAHTPQEKAICGSPKLSALDEQLAAAYKLQVAAAPAAMKADLRDDERGFLKSVAIGCSADKSQTLADCMTPQYEERIKVLQKSVIHKGGETFVARSILLLERDKQPSTPDQEANPGYGTLTVTWPQAVNPAPQWLAWNRAVTEATQSMAAPDSKAGTDGWQSAWAADEDADVTAILLHVDSRMVSTAIGTYFMGHGAARPDSSGINFHWLLTEKRELKAEDVFKPGSGWETFVAARCFAEAKKQIGANVISGLDEEDQDKKGIADTMAKPRNWTLDAKGLTIIFPEGSISPGEGLPEGVRIPWGVLHPYLAAGFTPPQ